jgi:hypothetical protein
VVKQHPLDISGYTEPTKTDYFFRGRYTDTELTQPFDIEYDRVMTGNLILYAKREKKPDPIIPSVPTPTPSSS